MKKIFLSTVAMLVLSSPVLAADDFKAGDFMVRARILGVVADESGYISNGTKPRVDNSVVPELDFSYFFTPNIAAELIAAVTPHDVETSLGTNVGGAWLLPPTLTLQYHFTQLDSFKPYVGAGLNYTHFFSTDAGVLKSVEYEDSFGGALQAGVDIPIRDNWYANIDVKKSL